MYTPSNFEFALAKKKKERDYLLVEQDKNVIGPPIFMQKLRLFVHVILFFLPLMIRNSKLQYLCSVFMWQIIIIVLYT